jgi:hypothetical protein
MPLFTQKPIPLFTAQQINTQADADAWVASLTETELVSGSRSFTNTRVEVDENEGTVVLKYTDNSEIGSENYTIDTTLGGYAIAFSDGVGINLVVESAEEFDRRYQPWPLPQD